jgi:Xaa-Pro aminopeptidase
MTTTSSSPVRHDRIERAQALMREQGVGAIVVLNHDDYRWFFGFDRTQPRAIIPATGAPALIAFTAEEAELRETVGTEDIMVWGSIGDVLSTALGNQTSAYITAALDAVTRAFAEGSLVAEGD